jgi:hypothetical protein
MQEINTTVYDDIGDILKKTCSSSATRTRSQQLIFSTENSLNNCSENRRATLLLQ